MISKEESRQKVRELVKFYDKNKEKFKGMSETDTRIKFIDRTFEFLGWDVFGTKISDEVQREESVKSKSSKLKRVDYILRMNGVSKLVVEAKSLGEDLDKDEYIKQVYEYAHNKPCSWAVLTNFKKVKIFYVDRDSFSPFYSIDVEDVTNFDDNFETLWLISKESIENNILDIEVKKRGTKKDKIPLDQQLFSDLKRWREILSKDIQKKYLDEYDSYTIDEIVQRIIDRIIFIRKAEDSELEERTLDQLTRRFNENTYKELKKIFLEYNEKYNSKLFGEDKKSLHEADSIEISNEVIEDVIRSTYKPKGSRVEYNFAVIGADILGNIYEQYLAYILSKTPKRTKLEGGKTHRKEQGIYYTPTYIVDYIVKNTLGELLKDKKMDPDKIKILDPACGSGSFLMRSFDYLVEHHSKKGKITQTKLDTSGVSATYTKKVDILKNNIYGVDLDTKAVEITQLNLLLKIAERGHRLPLLQQNIKCGNSLIDDEKVAGDKVFKWENEFKKVMQEGGFDVVIGNPPWVSIKGKHKSIDLSEEELDYFFKKYNCDTYMPNLYEIFIWKSLLLLKEGGFFSFIVPDRLCVNQQFINLRKYILENFSIKKLWFKVPFPGIIADTVIFVIEKRKRINNLVEVIEYPNKSSIKIPQKAFQESSDSAFFYVPKEIYDIFARVKSNKKVVPLNQIVLTTSGCGAKSNEINKERKNNRQIVILKGESIIKYQIRNKFWFEFIDNNLSGRTRDKKKLGKKFKVLLRKTGSDLIATFDDSGDYPEQSLYFLYTENDNEKEILLYLLGILNSKLMNCYYRYFAITNRDSTPQLKNIDLDRFPIIIPESQQQPIIELVDKMFSLNKHLNEIGDKKTDERSRIEGQIKKTDVEIDELVYKIYGITEEEKKNIEEN